MIILTAGHTGAGTGAQCATTQFDEGSETIWLRNRVAEILTNRYGLVVLMDDDTASLKLLTKALTENMSHTEDILHTEDLSHTECTECTEDAVASPAEDKLINDFEQSEKSKFRELRGFRERTNNSVREKESSVRNNNSAGVKSVEICRATLAQQESESLNPEGKKSFQSVLSVGDEKSRSEKSNSVSSVASVSEKENSVREKNNSVRNNNSAGVKSVEICRVTLAQQESESLNPEGKKSFQSVQSVGDEKSRSEKKSVSSVGSVREKERSVRDKNNSVSETTFLIDLHFNAHTNSNARGTETIVSDDATELELRMASRLAHTTSDALDIPLRGIKSESQTPHRRLAMLHLTPQSIILEVCFCTSPEDVETYRKNREKLAADLALAIYELF